MSGEPRALQRVYFVAHLPRVLNTRNRALWNDVTGFSFSEQSASSSSSYDTVRTHWFLVEITGDKPSLGPAVIISPVFVKAAEWKQAAVKKPDRQTWKEGGREGLADMLWYQMKGLLKAWELDSGGVGHVRTAGKSGKSCFSVQVFGKHSGTLAHVPRWRRLLSRPCIRLLMHDHALM